MKERIDYRARKWLFQKITSWRGSDQVARCKTTDWDILIVLDACRADVLQRTANWPVDIAVSPASCTPHWLQTVASEGLFDNTHIVSGNPQYEKVDAESRDATIEPFWESHWNKTLQTTLPDPILDRVDEIADGSSSTIAHLQQPHWPYVAKLGDEWTLAYDNLGPWDVGNERIDSLQVAMQRGLINVKQSKKAYEASISSVWETLLPYLSRWVDRDYTVIVTADHGETFGRIREFGFYEHPCGCHLRPLVNVPWIALDKSESSRTMNNVQDRLRALGYAE